MTDNTSYRGGGGGGGAGAVGGSSARHLSGAGGNGIYNAITDAIGSLAGLGQL